MNVLFLACIFKEGGEAFLPAHAHHTHMPQAHAHHTHMHTLVHMHMHLYAEEHGVSGIVEQHHGQHHKQCCRGKPPWDQSLGIRRSWEREISLHEVKPLKFCDVFVMAGGLVLTNAAEIIR